jgi:alkylation response protein AidB-like acyl-CoA dehydrogenase
MPTIDDFIRPKEWVSPFVSVEKACSNAMDFMGSYGYAREFDIEKPWRDQKVIGLRMGGKGLKTLENARYWFDLETL